MSDSGFTKKRLDLTITLGTGAFGETVGDTVTLTGLRMLADIANAGGESMGVLQLRVFGLRQEMMNKLTSIGTINPAIKAKNVIRIDAGDDDNGMHYVFQGNIFDAWADYNAAPDAVFNVIAYDGMKDALKPVSAISFKGSTDVSTIMSGIAKTMGLAFEDAGVSVKLSNPYFPGTALMQVRSCAKAADINYNIDRGTLIIWPKKSSRVGEIPLISPDTGMVGYPSLSSKGMTVRTMFNPKVQLGRDVQIKSSVPMASGKWNVSNVSHALSCEMPGGPWFTTFQCSHVTE